MMLAVETATAACSVALSDGNKTFFRYSKEPRSHSKKIINMIDDVLKNNINNIFKNQFLIGKKYFNTNVSLPDDIFNEILKI